MTDEELSHAQNEELNPSEEIENDQSDDDEIISLDDFEESEDAQDEDDAAEENEDENDDEDPQQDDADEFAVVEIDGQEYEVPSAIKDGYLRHSDYTQKTQEVAEQRRELDQRAQELEQQSQASGEELQDRVLVMNLEDQLKEYANVDWDKAEREDPAGASSHWRNYHQLKDKLLEATGRLEQRKNERTEQSERETATRLQETLDYAKNNIKGWTPEVDNNIADFAVNELGFTVDTLKSAYNPQVYNTLYLALIGSQSLKKQASAKPKPRVAAKPLKRVSSKSASSAKKSYDDMSMEEFAKARNGK